MEVVACADTNAAPIAGPKENTRTWYSEIRNGSSLLRDAEERGVGLTQLQNSSHGDEMRASVWTLRSTLCLKISKNALRIQGLETGAVT